GVTLENLKLMASPGFKVGNTGCGQSLQSGASCTADISFAPTAAGAQNGTFTVTSDDLGSGVAVPLSGMGFDFQAGVSGASSQTISSGQTASYLLSLVNGSGSSAKFALQCGSLPAYAACVFNPSSSTVPANASGSVG